MASDLDGTVELSRYDSNGARRIRGEVQDLFERSYVDSIESGDPFESIESFMGRFDAYVTNPSLDLIVARSNSRAVGQSWGWPLTKKTGWWSGLISSPEPRFTDEDGGRTFALSEMMVDRDHAGRGIASRLHNELLSTRRERRATLLVESDNERAHRTYLHWGWRYAGAQLRPGWPDAPTLDVMIRDLPVQCHVL